MYRYWLAFVALCCASGQALAYDLNLHRNSGGANDGDQVVIHVVTHGNGTSSKIYTVYWGFGGVATNQRGVNTVAATGTWDLNAGFISWTACQGDLTIRVVDNSTPVQTKTYVVPMVKKPDLGYPAAPPLPITVFTDTHHVYFNPSDCPPRNIRFKLTANLKIRTTVPVTLTVDGTVVYADVIVPPFYGGPQQEKFDVGPLAISHGDFSYAWAINGTVVDSGTYGCTDEIVGNIIDHTASYTQPAGTTDPGDPPVPGAEGGEKPDPAPFTPGVEAPNPPNAPSNPSGYVASGGTDTQGGMYAAVREALTDAANSTEQQDVPHRTPDSISDELERRGKLDDIQGQMSDIESKLNTAQAIGHKADNAKSWLTSNMPTSIGTVTSINFGTVQLAGISKSLVLDLTPFLGGVAIIRALILFGITALFVVVIIKTLRHYL